MMRMPPFFLVSLLILSQHYMEEWCTNTIFLSFWTQTQCALCIILPSFKACTNNYLEVNITISTLSNINDFHDRYPPTLKCLAAKLQLGRQHPRDLESHWIRQYE